MTLQDVAESIKLLAERNKIIAEGAGACPITAVLGGKCGKGAKKIVCVVSGGIIDNDKLSTILKGDVPESTLINNSKKLVEHSIEQ